MMVIGPGARHLVQTRYGFKVVVHDIGRPLVKVVEGTVETAAEIGNQHLDARGRRHLTDLTDAFNEVAGAAITQIVTVHRGDHHIRQLHGRNTARKVNGLLRVERIGTPVAHITEWATPGALVPHDHERGCALAKAFANIWT